MPDSGLVLALLQYAARGGASGEPQTNARISGSFAQRELDWVIEGGQGGLAHRASSAGVLALPAEWMPALAAADLMARLRNASQAETAAGAIDLLARQGIVPTLLKGISIAYECYADPSLRPRGDIDLLLPPGQYDRAAQALIAAGFEQSGMAVMHHGPPLRDTRTDVWLELHTDLFWPPETPLRRGSTFASATAYAQTLPSTWNGRAVGRLSPEYQLVYTCASWMHDLTSNATPCEPSYLASLFDIVVLLHRHGATIDWDLVATLLSTPMARSCAYVALSYVQDRALGTVPAQALRGFLEGQSYVGAFQARCIHALIDGYLVGGRRWRWPVPAPAPGRYRLGYQWRKRIRASLDESY